jgi:hypothetical protein
VPDGPDGPTVPPNVLGCEVSDILFVMSSVVHEYLIPLMVGGCLTLAYKPAWLMTFFGVAIFGYALFGPQKSNSDSEKVE